jgi:tetratricopeptide (TPR) repeat protein
MNQTRFQLCFRAAIVIGALSTLGLALGGCKTQAVKTADARADEIFTAGAKNPPTAETLYAMARIVRAQQNDPVQEYLLRRIIDEYPTFLPAYNDLGELRIRQNRLDEAIKVIDAGLAKAPKDPATKEPLDPILINNRGMARLFLGEPEKAYADFQKAAAQAPSETRYRANMATALGMLRRYDESLALFQQLVPEKDAHYNVAILAQNMKDEARAMEEFEKAKETPLERNPKRTIWESQTSQAQ